MYITITNDKLVPAIEQIKVKQYEVKQSKYNQVARILSPLINVLENLEQLCQDDDGIRKMIESGYGGMKKLRLDILNF